MLKKSINVSDIYLDNKKKLDLVKLIDVDDRKVEVKKSDVNRLGLALSGFLDYFAYDRIQVLGNTEVFYFNKLSSSKKIEIIENILKNFSVPCFVITNGLFPDAEFLKVSKKYNVPCFRTSFSTSHFIKEMNAYIEEKISSVISIHGVLVEVYGTGVLIRGESGIGKSECALDLLYKGHQLICDDLVKIKKKSGGILIGYSSNVMPYYMEIRGLGIINVKDFFGLRQILDKTSIDLVVELKIFDKNEPIDRLGNDKFFENILDVEIPKTFIPVKIARNLSGLVEIAAMKYRAIKQGIYKSIYTNK